MRLSKPTGAILFGSFLVQFLVISFIAIEFIDCRYVVVPVLRIYDENELSLSINVVK